MEDPDIKAIIKVCSDIAKKYNLGNNLVTGHKAGYFHEAMHEYVKLKVEEALKRKS